MRTEWQIEAVPELNGFIVEWLEEGNVFFSKENRIYRADSPCGTREIVGEIPASVWQRLVSKIRLGQRLLRLMCYNVIPLPDGSLFVVFNKEVGVISKGVYRPLKGRIGDRRALRGGCAFAGDGCVYWGDYISKPDRDSICVYRYRPGNDFAEIIHTFKKGEVRHIHGIYADPYTDDLWCVTGDRPHECKIIRSRDSFQSIATVGEGDESWRTVSLLFTPDAVFFASDAEFNKNYIYRLDRRTGKRAVVAGIDGPAYYSSALGEDLLFSVTAELCQSQKGIFARLWHVSPEGRSDLILSYPKDLISNSLLVKFFLPGTINFPQGPGLKGETYLHGVGLRGIDNRTLRLKVQRESCQK